MSCVSHTAGLLLLVFDINAKHSRCPKSILYCVKAVSAYLSQNLDCGFSFVRYTITGPAHRGLAEGCHCVRMRRQVKVRVDPPRYTATERRSCSRHLSVPPGPTVPRHDDGKIDCFAEGLFSPLLTLQGS